MHGFRIKRGDFNLDNAKKAVEVFNGAGKVLKEHGITFCYRAHGYEFRHMKTGPSLTIFSKIPIREYVSFEMDIMWIQFGGGDPVKFC